MIKYKLMKYVIEVLIIDRKINKIIKIFEIKLE
jgi:hypothetical protein